MYLIIVLEENYSRSLLNESKMDLQSSFQQQYINYAIQEAAKQTLRTRWQETFSARGSFLLGKTVEGHTCSAEGS